MWRYRTLDGNLESLSERLFELSTCMLNICCVKPVVKDNTFLNCSDGNCIQHVWTLTSKQFVESHRIRTKLKFLCRVPVTGLTRYLKPPYVSGNSKTPTLNEHFAESAVSNREQTIVHTVVLCFTTKRHSVLLPQLYITSFTKYLTFITYVSNYPM